MRTQIVLLLVPEQANIHVRVEAGSRAAGDDGAAPLKTLHRDRPGLGAGMFEDDIGTAAAGDFAHFLKDVVLLAMKDVIRSEVAAEFELVVAGGYRNRMGVVEFGD